MITTTINKKPKWIKKTLLFFSFSNKRKSCYWRFSTRKQHKKGEREREKKKLIGIFIYLIYEIHFFLLFSVKFNDIKKELVTRKKASQICKNKKTLEQQQQNLQKKK